MVRTSSSILLKGQRGLVLAGDVNAAFEQFFRAAGSYSSGSGDSPAVCATSVQRATSDVTQVKDARGTVIQ